MHYLAKERKRKKKKLKSRRERNKRKAILKLSHIPKSHALPSGSGHASSLPPPPGSITNPSNQSQLSDDKKSDDKKGVAELVSPLGGLGEAPKNNGIPMFVQERIEERMKRNESSEILLNEASVQTVYSGTSV